MPSGRGCGVYRGPIENWVEGAHPLIPFLPEAYCFGYPAVSPDRSQIALQTYPGDGQCAMAACGYIEVLDVATGRLTRVTEGIPVSRQLAETSRILSEVEDSVISPSSIGLLSFESYYDRGDANRLLIVEAREGAAPQGHAVTGSYHAWAPAE